MFTLHLKEQGETLTFFSEPDSTAPTVEFECTIAPGKTGPEPHKHPLQTETFRVTKGRMLAMVDGEEHLIPTGESIVISPGQTHTFSNPDPSQPLTMRIVMEPALNIQWFLTEAARSAIRNGGSWKDIPLFEVGYIVAQVVDEHDYPNMPPLIKRLLFGALARAAVLLNKTAEIAPLEKLRATA
jgi:quercetin dioxygenase-like cupin family protein